jgi:hypothetical protein
MKRLVAKSMDAILFLPPAETIVVWAERKVLAASGIQIKISKGKASPQTTEVLRRLVKQDVLSSLDSLSLERLTVAGIRGAAVVFPTRQ